MPDPRKFGIFLSNFRKKIRYALFGKQNVTVRGFARCRKFPKNWTDQLHIILTYWNFASKRSFYKKITTSIKKKLINYKKKINKKEQEKLNRRYCKKLQKKENITKNYKKKIKKENIATNYKKNKNSEKYLVTKSSDTWQTGSFAVKLQIRTCFETFLFRLFFRKSVARL